jgi:hypothetical protein
LFLVLAFGPAWIGFLVVWLTGIPLISPAAQLFLVPAWFTPAVAAVAAVALRIAVNGHRRTVD